MISHIDRQYLCCSDSGKLENQVGETNVNWTEKVKWLIWYLTQRYDKCFDIGIVASISKLNLSLIFLLMIMLYRSHKISFC
jgi:hypothetical protein